MKSYLIQDNVASIPHNIILFELDFDLKFPLLHLLQFLSDLKSTVLVIKYTYGNKYDMFLNESKDMFIGYVPYLTKVF